MSILSHYTLRCLKQNRVRTLVTLIGIILSVSLFTAVAEGAWSGRQYMLDVATLFSGSYHGLYAEISDAELAELRAQEGIQEIATLDNVGWALVGQGTYPYLRIGSMSEGFDRMVSLRLLEGRMPEHDRELLISDRAADATGAELAVGQQLTLTVGQRQTLEGLALGEEEWYLEEEECLQDATTEQWTIVGLYERLDSSIESYAMPGSLALTVGGTGETHTAVFTLDRVADTLDFLRAHSYGSRKTENDTLLYFYGVSENNVLVSFLYGLVSILFVLIFFGSVSLIYNSFAISVSERTKQFGLLKSIGATKRQIRHAVLTEALLLCLVAIPLGLAVGCGGLGLTLRFLRPTFDKFLDLDYLGLGQHQVSLGLHLHLPSLALAAGIGLCTALVSAWIPAKRATRLSPIAAIRQSADIKLGAKKVRVSPLIGWLFGFPATLAARNFKRSRKQYRSTVISLFLSILLFISAFSFSDYLRKNVGENLNRYVPDLILTCDWEDLDNDLTELAALGERLQQAEHAEAVQWAVHTREELRLPRSIMSQEALTSDLFQGEDGNFPMWPSLYLVPEAEYRALCQKAGLDPEKRQALAYAKAGLIHAREEGHSYQICSLLRKDSLPLQLSLSVALAPEHLVYVGTQYDENYENKEYLFRSAEAGKGKEAWRGEDLIAIAPEEVEGQWELTVGAFLEERPLLSDENRLTLYLPLSGSEELLRNISNDALLAIQAPAHELARKELQTLLREQDAGSLFSIYDTRESDEANQAVLLVLNVFSFGFIVLISLIAVANVFNTISTNVGLRRREFATLKSVGMGNRAFGRMMYFECLLYGAKALLWGLPISIGVSWLIWKVVSDAFISPFRLPWLAMGIASGAVFVVVFATMLYAARKIKKEDPINALKQD